MSSAISNVSSGTRWEFHEPVRRVRKEGAQEHEKEQAGNGQYDQHDQQKRKQPGEIAGPLGGRDARRRRLREPGKWREQRGPQLLINPLGQMPR